MSWTATLVRSDGSRGPYRMGQPVDGGPGPYFSLPDAPPKDQVGWNTYFGSGPTWSAWIEIRWEEALAECAAEGQHGPVVDRCAGEAEVRFLRAPLSTRRSTPSAAPEAPEE